MKLKGIYHNPRKKIMTSRMMIKAVVRTVNQKSEVQVLQFKCLKRFDKEIILEHM